MEKFTLLAKILRVEPDAGWQKLRKGAKGLRRKVWTQTKILSPNIHFGQKMGFLWSKTVFLAQDVQLCTLCTITSYILHIILNQICKFAITRKNDAFVAKIANTHFPKFFVAIFALAKKAANFCHPA